MPSPRHQIARSGERSDFAAPEFQLSWRLGGSPAQRQGLFRFAEWSESGGTDIYAETFTEVNFSTQAQLDSDFFGVELGSSSRKTVKEDGWYRVVCSVNLYNSTANEGMVLFRLRKNNTTTIERAQFRVPLRADLDYNHGYQEVLVELAADDYIAWESLDLQAASAENKLVSAQNFVRIELISATAETMLGGQVVAGRTGTIHRAILTKGTDPASSGNTTIDVLKNGYSILASGSLSIAAGTDLELFDSNAFSDTDVQPQDVFEVSVDGETTPPCRDLGLFVICRPKVESTA